MLVCGASRQRGAAAAGIQYPRVARSSFAGPRPRGPPAEHAAVLHCRGGASRVLRRSAAPRRLDRRSKAITWYHERFRGSGKSLRTADAQNDLKSLTEYLESFYFPWWQQIHGAQTSTVVRLFNAAGLIPRGNGKFEVDLRASH